MSISGAVVLEVATSLGMPIIKKFLRNKLGDKAGGIGGKIADGLVDAVSKRVEATHGPVATGEIVPPKVIEEAVTYVEQNEAADIVELEVRSQEAANKLMIAEMEKGPWWTWAWRPGMMHLLGFLWFWALFAQSVVNAFLTDNLPPVDLEMLFAVTGLYMTLYLGGHTVKSFIKKRG
jgi:hypothetical protein